MKKPLKRYERRSAEDRAAYLKRVRRQLEEDKISLPRGVYADSLFPDERDVRPQPSRQLSLWTGKIAHLT